MFSSVASIARKLDMAPNPILSTTQLNCAYKLLALDLCIKSLALGVLPFFLAAPFFFSIIQTEKQDSLV